MNIKDLQAYEEVEFNSNLYVTKEYKVTRTDTVSKEEYTNIVNFLLKNGFDEMKIGSTKFGPAIYFGTNEAISYESFEEFKDCFEVKEITKEVNQAL